MSYIAIRQCSSGAVIGSRVMRTRDEAEAEVKAWSEGIGPAAVAPATPAIRQMTRRNDSGGLAAVLADLLREPAWEPREHPALEYPHGVEIRTNYVPRDIINAWELTEAEREDFSYLDWEAIEEGEDSAEFFRFQGDLYFMGDFMRTSGSDALAGWDGYAGDSYFSGTLIRFPLIEPANRYHAAEYDYEQVIVATYFAH